MDGVCFSFLYLIDIYLSDLGGFLCFCFVFLLNTFRPVALRICYDSNGIAVFSSLFIIAGGPIVVD